MQSFFQSKESGSTGFNDDIMSMDSASFILFLKDFYTEMNTKNLPVALILTSFILMSAVFVIDLQLPLGVAGGVPYVAVILISLWFRDKNYVIGLAVICSVLTVAGFYFSPHGGESWKVMANRSLALFAIWATAILAINWEITRNRILRCKYETEKQNEKKEIYIATIYGAQHVTNNLLNQLKVVELEIQKYKDFDKEVSDLFDDMLLEARALLVELSSVKEIDVQHIKQSVSPNKNS